jgi:hypothetical protein
MWDWAWVLPSGIHAIEQRVAQGNVLRDVFADLNATGKSLDRHGNTLQQVLPRLDKKSLQLYRGLTKNLSSVLIQMRTGKIRLGAYLHSIRVNDTDVCQCGEAPQTVAHVLMDCRDFELLRVETWEGREKIPRNLEGFLAD